MVAFKLVICLNRSLKQAEDCLVPNGHLIPSLIRDLVLTRVLPVKTRLAVNTSSVAMPSSKIAATLWVREVRSNITRIDAVKSGHHHCE